MANKNWLEIFGWVGVELLTSGRSDHQLILLLTAESYSWDARMKKIFRFEAQWALDKG